MTNVKKETFLEKIARQKAEEEARNKQLAEERRQKEREEMGLTGAVSGAKDWLQHITQADGRKKELAEESRQKIEGPNSVAAKVRRRRTNAKNNPTERTH
jgi:hypothetical protein